MELYFWAFSASNPPNTLLEPELNFGAKTDGEALAPSLLVL